MEICDQHKLIVEQLLDHQEFVGSTSAKISALNDKVDLLTEIAKENRGNILDLKKCLVVISTSTNARDARDEKLIQENVPGFAGSLNRAFNKIIDNFAFYLLMGSGLLLAWYFLQVILLKLGLRSTF